MAAERDIESRLTALEKAVETLRAPKTSGEEPHTTADSALWALEGLRARAPQGGAVLYTGAVDLPSGGTVQWQYGLPSNALFSADWSEQAAVLAALGHPVRLRILRAVLDGTNTAAALVEALETGTSGQIYHHLKELTSAGWLTSPQRARYVVPTARVVPLLAILLAAGTPG